MGRLRVVDDRQVVLHLSGFPEKIVSLVPSETYNLVRLGAKGRLVGRTRYCVAPSGEVEDVAEVGGTKDVDVERVLALSPDLVLANQEENAKAQIKKLEDAGLKVLVSFPRRVAAGLAHLARLTRALGLEGEEGARARLSEGYRLVREAEEARGSAPPVRAFCPIWMDPLMTIHGDTFISDMLDLCGGQNVFADRPRRYPLAADIAGAEPLSPERVGDRDTRYPRVTLDEVEARAPEVVLLPDEPHAFSEGDAEVFRALRTPASKAGRVLFCDGKDLMWPGARSLEGIERIRALLAPPAG